MTRRAARVFAGAMVLAAPTIQPQDQTFTSFGGVAVVSGDFTRRQAEAVAVLARARNGR